MSTARNKRAGSEHYPSDNHVEHRNLKNPRAGDGAVVQRQLGSNGRPFHPPFNNAADPFPEDEATPMLLSRSSSKLPNATPVAPKGGVWPTADTLTPTHVSSMCAICPQLTSRGVGLVAEALRTPNTGRMTQLPSVWNLELARAAASFGTVSLSKQALEAAFQLFKRLDTDGSGGLDEQDLLPLEQCLCFSDTQRRTRRKLALEAIVVELRLHEADNDGNNTVDFVEFMDAFRSRALQERMQLTGAAVSGHATFAQLMGDVQTELNRRVILLVSQMAELLESGDPELPVTSP
jgi:hypothetical protein